MKHVMLATLFAGMASISALAETQAPAQPGNGTSRTDQAVAPAPNGQGVQASGQPIRGKTHAEVHQELLRAERDGELTYLNSTVYAHP
jgi:hypothetical protein